MAAPSPPPPRREGGKSRPPRPAPLRRGPDPGVPGGPRRRAAFPLAGSRGAGPRGRSPPRPGERVAPLALSPGSPPRPRAGPRSPTLRANPFPEVTDPFCRLPLPTLFRWLEALHLGDLMRLWVRPGGNTIAVPQVFMGRWGASRTPRRLGRPASRPALSPGEPIPGRPTRPASDARGCQGEKRTLLGASTGVLGSLALPRRSAPPSVRGS